jgi:lipopolysaccharide/colanic/teichoic acid biosynthesis glycosyltransferase
VVVKRALDVALALLLIVLTSPMLLLAAAAVLLTSGRPVFFGHLRVGRRGVPFRCWKLRTSEGAELVLVTNPTLHARYVSITACCRSPPIRRVTPLGALRAPLSTSCRSCSTC